MRTTRPLRLALLAAALPLVLVACGDDGDGDSAAPSDAPSSAAGTDGGDEATFPVTIETANGPVEIAEQPEQIVSLSATATEMLFAVGAGEAVVAADSFSNYPAEAPTTDLSGLEPNIEAIVGYDPDLVIASNDPGELVSGLDAVGIPAIVLPAAVTLDDTYTQLEQLGAVTGHVGDAAELVGELQADVDELVAQVPADAPPVTYYHELDPNFFTVTSSTFIGEIYSMAGMTNIADEAPDAAGGYPQLSPEFVVTANPDVIFFADGGAGGVVAEDIASRPGWDQLTAVQEDRIVEVDPDIASRWGPRIVDFLRTVIEERTALAPVE
ncbi:ABC transporter substrate-binding protein [Jiangella alkaliphila]|uniref:Iron complex transport system substrate-binding protein n=1 Tax=Jiangella alkaliphila TaxID=419479 RepID=A0A1H2HHP3_9ACTN|nr:ABC transporter substrate-binding protein [Jiangella alkaliphila]SDU31344.1 iron complex transport system substrate-binding protein [Jiangella alkaliphila]